MKIKVTGLFILFVASSSLSAVEPIYLAISNSTKGPVKQLGLNLNLGSEIYFNKINLIGGIKRSQVRFRKMNDGYEPINTVFNTKRFITHHPVALFNYVGTPTTKAILPLIKQHRAVLFAPFTGAGFLREQEQAHIVNLRASYYSEAKAQVDYLIHKANIRAVGLVIQADDFGLALEKHFVGLFEQKGLNIKVTARFRRNSKDISTANALLQQEQVDAVLFVGTYEPLSELINLADRNSFNPLYSTVSFVSSDALFKRIDDKHKVLVTEVVPNPNNCQLPVCYEFQQDAINAGYTELNHVMFEGYLNAKLFNLIMSDCKPSPNQSCLINNYRNSRYDLGGIEVNLNDLGNNLNQSIFVSSQNLPIAFD